MIGILIVAHGSLADSLVECAIHVLGQSPRGLATIDFIGHADPDERQKALQAKLAELAALNDKEGDGILVLTDVYGATPSNTLCRLLEPAHIEGVSGVNLPMLLKALNYRDTLALPQLVERIVEGGRNSINHISETMCHAATGR
jgi:PTS system ascorbate-specific IIA component